MNIEVNAREFGLILDALSSYRMDIYKSSKKKDVEKWRKKNLENDGKAIEKLLNDFGASAIKETEKNLGIK